MCLAPSPQVLRLVQCKTQGHFRRSIWAQGIRVMIAGCHLKVPSPLTLTKLKNMLFSLALFFKIFCRPLAYAWLNPDSIQLALPTGQKHSNGNVET